MLKTILLDDHRLFCDGLEKLLHESGHFQVVGKFHSGQEFLRKINQLQADLMIIDVEMPGLNGFDVIERLRSNDKELKIVVVSMHETLAYSQEAAELGANAYMVKSLEGSELIQRLLHVSEGEDIFLRKPKALKTVSLLSERETEVIKLLSTGKTTEQISTTLKISPLTVKTHRTNLFRKLQVKNSAELISKAYRLGII